MGCVINCVIMKQNKTTNKTHIVCEEMTTKGIRGRGSVWRVTLHDSVTWPFLIVDD